MAGKLDKSGWEALYKKVTEDNRKQLEKLWRQVEALEAAIQSAKDAHEKSRQLAENQDSTD